MTVRCVEKKKLSSSGAPPDDRNLPDVHLGLHDDVIVFGHVEKVKAMELIDQLGVTRRGPYSGGFGGISFSGDMDIALLVLMQSIHTGM
ncbi:hypothetical protein OIU76_020498 [Salix suchowensis]|nr:hypothetical protein OIU76_020498 [Salix suchowensis]